MGGTVLLVGAGGTLGTRVERLAVDAAPGVRVIRASRRGEAALGPGARVLDVTDRATFDAALGGVDVLVNAAGPYRYDPAPLVRACAGRGVHYVDLAESPEFVARVRTVTATGSALVPGCSTVPGLVELLARPYFETPSAARVDAWLSMGSSNAVSGALLQGLLAPLGRPSPDGDRYFGRVETRRIGDRTLRFGLHPSGCERTPLPVRLFAGFDRGILVRALRLAAPALGRLSDRAVERLARAAAPFASLARPFGTPRGVLRVEAVSANGEPLAAVEVEARRDGLDVPAWPAVWVARRLLEGDAALTGPLALSDVLSHEEALAELRTAGFEVREDVGSGR